MKMANNASSVERSGNLGRAGRFTMAATGKAFEALSSGLYKDAVRAVVRELGTNAADAHIEAGKRNIPFVVHLPSNLEPWFSVQDLGVGLNDRQIRGYSQCVNGDCKHTEDADFDESQPCVRCGGKLEFVQGIYTIYFDSSKTHSDDYTGCLGLGSKSPFSMSDSFTVTAVKDGVKNVYTCYRNDGTPGVDRLSTEQTDEPNGVEVKLPVANTSFSEFRDRAKQVYTWFEPQPMIAGLPLKRETPTLETGDWAIYPSHEYNDRTMAVLMGNVHYLVNTNEWDKTFRASLTERELFVAEKLGPLLKVGIGEVDMAISRESLKYSPKTYAAIKKRLKQVVAELVRQAEAEVAKAENLWDARLIFTKLANEHHMRSILTGAVKWQGRLVSDVITVFEGTRRVSCRRYQLNQTRKGKLVLNSDEPDMIHVHGGVQFFINDVNTAFNIRIRDYLMQYGAAGSKKYYGNSEDKTTIREVFMIYGTPAQVDKFVKTEEIQSVTRLLSEIEIPERTYEKREKTAKLVQFDPGHSSMPTRSWNNRTIELDEGTHVYVEISGYNWRAGSLNLNGEPSRFNKPLDGFQRPSALQAIMEQVENFLGVPSYQLIGVRQAWVPKVAKLSNWTRLDHYMKKQCVESPAVLDKSARMLLWKKLSGAIPILIKELDTEQVNSLKPTSIMRQLHEVYNYLADYDSGICSSCVNACAHTGVTLPDLSKIQKRVEWLRGEYQRRYPILHTLLPHAYHAGAMREGSKAVLEYVSLMDRRPLPRLHISKAPKPETEEGVAA